jgi:hypothetical protein
VTVSEAAASLHGHGHRFGSSGLPAMQDRREVDPALQCRPAQTERLPGLADCRGRVLTADGSGAGWRHSHYLDHLNPPWVPALFLSTDRLEGFTPCVMQQ